MRKFTAEQKVYLIFGSIIAILILTAVAQAIAVASQVTLR